MSENPQSIWRRPLKHSMNFVAGVLIFFLLGVTIALTVLYLITAPGSSPITTLMVSVVLALACVTLLALCLRWLRHWRNLRRVLIGLACFVTMIGLFYTIENWRGAHAWNKFKREWKAKGTKLEPQDFIPAPVPDDKNFALTPIASSAYAAYFDKDGHEINPRKTNVVNRMQ